jgi:uncharacterized protein YkwD
VDVLRKKHIFIVPVVTFVLFAFVASAGARIRVAHRSATSTLLQAVNRTRVAYGLQPLHIDATLVRAARSHSVDMLRGNYFAHGDFHGRMVAFHVRGPVAGENLAWGNGSYASAASIIREWLASPEHRANLLHRGWTRIGIGITNGTFLGNAGASIVTADFAGS